VQSVNLLPEAISKLVGQLIIIRIHFLFPLFVPTKVGMEQKAAHERQPSIDFSHKLPCKAGQLTVRSVRGRRAHRNLIAFRSRMEYSFKIFIVINPIQVQLKNEFCDEF
jgi:hypothetical protein